MKIAVIFLVSFFIGLQSLLAQVVINELMWMGSTASTADEWIELRNTTSQDVDLSNWDVTKNSDGVEILMLTIPAGKSIPAGGYFLISNNTKENSKINVDPDLVTTSVSLANTKLQIKLYDGQWDGGGNLIDTADDGIGAPAAGDNTNKYSMVRGPAPGNYTPGDGTLASNWHTADRAAGWDAGATEKGTPSNDNSLPVELSSFTASCANNAVILRWVTESELNNAGFFVLRAEDEKGPFNEVSSFITGAGTSTDKHNYSYHDERIETGKSYWYQLKQINTDGTFQVYGPKKIIVRENTENNQGALPTQSQLVGNYPNPFNPGTTISLTIGGDNETATTVAIYDLLGQHVRTIIDRSMQPGFYELLWDGTNDFGLNVPSGAYFCKMFLAGGSVSMLKLLKMN